MRRSILSASLGVLLALAGAAQAGPITIQNSGFESTVLNDGVYTLTAPPNWAYTGSSLFGTWNPNGSFVPPEGQNSGFAWAGTLSQTLSDVLAANTTYTLTTAVGRWTGGTTMLWQVQLLAGATVLASVDQSAGPALSAGEFRDFALTFTTSATHADLGAQLQIRLINPAGAPTAATEVNWDNVRLDASAAQTVPLPSAAWMGLSLVGAIGILAMVRRQRLVAAR